MARRFRFGSLAAIRGLLRQSAILGCPALRLGACPGLGFRSDTSGCLRFRGKAALFRFPCQTAFLGLPGQATFFGLLGQATLFGFVGTAKGLLLAGFQTRLILGGFAGFGFGGRAFDRFRLGGKSAFFRFAGLTAFLGFLGQAALFDLTGAAKRIPARRFLAREFLGCPAGFCGG